MRDIDFIEGTTLREIQRTFESCFANKEVINVSLTINENATFKYVLTVLYEL